MKALVIQKPDTLAVCEVEQPAMGEYDALCELLYGATCAGTDLHVIHGTFGIPVDYPAVIGHESVGRVVRVGSRVRSFKTGDLISRVGTLPTAGMHIAWGGMAQFGIARDHKAMREDGCDKVLWDGFRVNKVIPAGIIDPLDATMIITWRETLSYVKRMGVGPGAKVLISGSGANGFSHARQALNLGADSVAFIGSAARAGTAQKLGVAAYVDYRDEAALEAFLQGHRRTFDFIIDATGKSGSLDRLLPCLVEKGAVGVYGMDDYRNYQIRPLNAGATFTFYDGGYDEEETHEMVLDFIRQGKLDAGLWLDREHVFPLRDAAAAYRHVEEKRAIKAVVKLT